MTEEHQQQIEAPVEDNRIEANAAEQNDAGEVQEPQADEQIEAVVVEPDDMATQQTDAASAFEQIEDEEPDEEELQEEDASALDEQIEADEADEVELQEEGTSAVDEIEAETEEQDDEEPQDADASQGDEQTAPAEPEPDFELTVESVIEAVLFASDETLTPARLAGIVESGVKQVRKHIENLNNKYRAAHNAFRIEQIAGGYQMMTLSPYNHWLKKLLRVRADGKLSPAALETLAIVAYKQPVIRADIEVIRGVAVGEVLRGLMYKGLVKIVGRAEVLGRPMLYGTTKKFLEIFGLNSLKDLPKVEELKKPPA